MKISSDIIDKHGIKPNEYKKIISLIGREPNLLELGKSTQHFVDALRKLSEYSVKDDHSVSSYFSTHPLTEDRINNISRIHAQ